MYLSLLSAKMADSKSKKPLNPESMELIQNEVASYASSIGLSSSIPGSGFNDSDFRKTGTLKAPKASKLPKTPSKPEDFPGKTQKKKEQIQKPKPKVFESAFDQNKGCDRFKNLPKLPLVKASVLEVWYAHAAELEAKVLGKEGKKKLESKSMDEWKLVVAKKKEVAERLMAQYVQDYESSKGQSGDLKMLVTTAKSGTAADKVSAFSVMVGENPIANLRSLDALLGMVASKVGKRHALTGFEALKELFVSSLLPDRKLKTLLQQPLNHLPETKDGYSLLLLWYWEECLKQRYERFVISLEEASRDMLPILKDKATKTMYALLRSKPEQERRLLSALVNKLGDPGAKGASYADYHLSNLLSDHPNMKAVVIEEVDAFLFRPHLGLRAKYHAVNFLSQIRLSNRGDGPKVAKRLLDVYFALFKVLISEAGGEQKIDKKSKAGGNSVKNDKAKDASKSHVEMDSRLLSVLLTGVNRAFPYVSSTEADDIVEVQTPLLFQLVHSNNFNVGVQALMLLDKISAKNQIVSDRFYRALYSKLLLPSAMNSSKAEMFIGLLLRAMKNDVNLKRVAAFAKRILQMAIQQPPQYACGCLFLLSEVLKARPPLWNTVLQNESVDDELEHFEDIVEETGSEPSIIEETKNKENNLEQTKDKWNSVLQALKSSRESENVKSHNDSSEDEDEDDDNPASDSESDGSDEGEDLLIANDLKNLQESKALSDHKGNQSQEPVAKSHLPGGYDPRHREPSYCNADHVSWWELSVLASHVHPSVATMARTILSGAHIVYNGNPLNDLSLSAFLDKLMEKKPKQSTWHGGSQIEPAKKMNMNHNLIGAEILSLAESEVPPEDLVFHKFYANKLTTSKKPKKKKKKEAAEDEAAGDFLDEDDEEIVDGGDESDNEEIEDMLDAADPSLESNSDYDYDDLDRVAGEDDDDLVGNISDTEMDIPLDMAGEEDDEDLLTTDNNSEDSDSEIEIGDGDPHNSKKRKQKKAGGKAGKSPFASLEDYEHLLDKETPAGKKPKSRKRSTEKKSKSRKKRKSTG